MKLTSKKIIAVVLIQLVLILGGALVAGASLPLFKQWMSIEPMGMEFWNRYWMLLGLIPGIWSGVARQALLKKDEVQSERSLKWGIALSMLLFVLFVAFILFPWLEPLWL